MSEELELKLLQEIEELKKELSKSKKINKQHKNKKQNNIYTYSKITLNILNSLVKIKKEYETDKINYWINNNIEIDNSTEIFLKELLDKNKFLLSSYNEEDLKMKFLSFLIGKVNFQILEKRLRDFYEVKITYQTENFILTGTTDFLVSKGLEYSEKPYFFIQEFKKSEAGDGNTEAQLITELISAVELNNLNSIKGAYIIGSIWNFVMLDRLEKHSYKYYVSENFDSSKINDLKSIYRNLLFVKNEIIEIVNNEIDNE